MSRNRDSSRLIYTAVQGCPVKPIQVSVLGKLMADLDAKGPRRPRGQFGRNDIPVGVGA